MPAAAQGAAAPQLSGAWEEGGGDRTPSELAPDTDAPEFEEMLCSRLVRSCAGPGSLADESAAAALEGSDLPLC